MTNTKTKKTTLRMRVYDSTGKLLQDLRRLDHDDKQTRVMMARTAFWACSNTHTVITEAERDVSTESRAITWALDLIMHEPELIIDTLFPTQLCDDEYRGSWRESVQNPYVFWKRLDYGNRQKVIDLALEQYSQTPY